MEFWSLAPNLSSDMYGFDNSGPISPSGTSFIPEVFVTRDQLNVIEVGILPGARPLLGLLG